MGTSYHTIRRVNREEFEIESAVGCEQKIVLSLESYSAPTEEESDLDSAVLRFSVDDRQVAIGAKDIAKILHPLIEALRILLDQQCANEDELNDAWSKP